jgi:hypothetical protein
MADPFNVPISIRRYRDFYLSVQEKTMEGNPWDLRGFTICMAIKANVGDPDNKALYLSEAFYSENLGFGSYSFLVPHSVTSGSGFNVSSAVYEVVYKDPNNVIQTRIEGTATIGPSVVVTVP